MNNFATCLYLAAAAATPFDLNVAIAHPPKT